MTFLLDAINYYYNYHEHHHHNQYQVIWSAAIAIFSSGVIGYLEFNGTNNKINRYSFTVHALQELMLWWQTLSPIDRSMVSELICVNLTFTKYYNLSSCLGQNDLILYQFNFIV